jgi:hypothetical protein
MSFPTGGNRSSETSVCADIVPAYQAGYPMSRADSHAPRAAVAALMFGRTGNRQAQTDAEKGTAAPKSKIQFNGAGGLRTYIDFTRIGDQPTC